MSELPADDPYLAAADPGDVGDQAQDLQAQYEQEAIQAALDGEPVVEETPSVRDVWDRGPELDDPQAQQGADLDASDDAVHAGGFNTAGSDPQGESEALAERGMHLETPDGG